MYSKALLYMKLNSRIRLLDRYLKRTATDRQNRLVDKWYHAVDDTQEIDCWQEEGRKEAVRGSLQLALARYMDRHPGRRVAIFQRSLPQRLLAAASIAAIILAGYWLLNHSREQKPEQYFSVTAPFGAIKEVLLPDSSRVWLKPGAVLQYSSLYGTAERRLTLSSGEAFFSVQPDRAKPFIVQTKQLETQVLGTAFDIQAYDESPRVQVWVEHGRVQVSDSIRVLRELTKGQRLSWNKQDGSFATDSLSWNQALAWQKGVLLLESASFTELALQLKELYGVELIASGNHIRQLHFDAKLFIKTPVEDIVATLAKVHGIQYRIWGKQVLFY